MNGMGDLCVVRDPNGFRPLCYAIDGPLFAAASESLALSNLGFTTIKTVQPGEMVLIQDNQIRVERYAQARSKTAHCFFEWIYFANVASTLDERSVYLSRAALGKELAIQEHRLGLIKPDYNTVVVPVPDTGKAAADAMAYELGVPSVEGLMRNRHIGRTFIEGNNRADRVKMKFSPLREVLEGRRVILVEDSIVRSTTLKSLLSLIRERGGAKEIHVRVACPPIIAPCFYGIDMSTIGELYAPRFMRGKLITIEEQQAMARALEADSLFYLPLDAIARCIRMPADRLCRACITGEYPTEAGKRMYQLALRQHEEGGGDRRTYESGPKNGCG
jgi:amidophosphoribosyltransferase